MKIAYKLFFYVAGCCLILLNGGCVRSDNNLEVAKIDTAFRVEVRSGTSSIKRSHLKSTLYSRNSLIVFLGETHNNSGHHRHQAQILKEIIAKGKTPSIIMEMISEDQVKVLSSYRNGPRRETADLRKILDWDNTGWPDFEIYAPIFQVILDHDLTLRHGASPDETLQGWRRGEHDKNRVSPYEDLRQLYGPEKAGAIVSSWREQTHCGLMGEEDLGHATQQQLYRDRYMADQVKAALAAGADPVVVIAGSSHTREDRGIPVYLDLPPKKIITLAFTEIDPNKPIIGAYIKPGIVEGRPRHDYLWFTEAMPKDDTCAKLNKLLGRE